MRLIDGRTGIEVLERAECLDLLRANEVGRVAVVEAGHPVIFPVNYGMDGEHVVFRTAPGTKLDATMRGAPVSFEVDELDRAQRRAWSVVVTGWARLVETPEERARAVALDLQPWSEHEKDHFVAVYPERITGRRIGPAD